MTDEPNLSVGKVAKITGLSRSTLLHYEKRGLLSPIKYGNSGYRLYNQKHLNQIERIKTYRSAGLSLENIDKLLTLTLHKSQQLLEQRLVNINDEIHQLREQQRLLLTLLQPQNKKKQSVKTVTKEQWSQMLGEAGLDEEGKWRWHSHFEKKTPEAHQDFLESLGLSETEIEKIRKKSRSIPL